MKTVILFLLFSFSLGLNAQRDTILQSVTYGDIDTFNLGGGLNSLKYIYFTDGSSTAVTDTTSLTVAAYIDSLISVNQNDSIANVSAADFYYRKYIEANTILQSKINLLNKLWAIKP